MGAQQGIVFDPPIDGGIVVGHDGSAPSDAALAWAVVEAVAHRCPLHVVRAWTLATASTHVDAPFGVVPSFDDCAAAVRRLAQDAVDAELDRAGGPDLPLRVHVVHGAAGAVLVAAAQAADVIIVGHQGHGRLESVLDPVLGSVALHVLRHAPCPVTVLRGGREAAAAQPRAEARRVSPR
jgi:nucleotide-binding universal stress UspA family protein